MDIPTQIDRSKSFQKWVSSKKICKYDFSELFGPWSTQQTSRISANLYEKLIKIQGNKTKNKGYLNSSIVPNPGEKCSVSADLSKSWPICHLTTWLTLLMKRLRKKKKKFLKFTVSFL